MASDLANKKLNVVIVGGSLAGLMHGIMLKSLGHDVTILEQSVTSLRSDNGAGISTGPTGRAYFKEFDHHDYPLGFDSPGFQFLNPDDSIKRLLPVPLLFTGWTTLYYRLRAMFDGLQTSYCPSPKPVASQTDSVGRTSFAIASRVTTISLSEGLVAVEYEHVTSADDENTAAFEGHTIYADLAIDASGANSQIRRSFFPNLAKQYAGYVGWRGTVKETDVSEKCSALFTGASRFNLLPTKTGYIVGYVVPGPDGRLEPGSRLLNYVWYDILPEHSDYYREAMTDADGNAHRNTLPKGKMAVSVKATQQKRAKALLSPAFQELVLATESPFISTVRDCYAPSLSLLGGRLLLVGEAASMIRPHAGAAVEQAALQCFLLRKVLRGEIDMGEWETGVKRARTQVTLFSKCIGNFYLASWWVFGVTLLRYMGFSLWLRVVTRWSRAKL